MAAKAVSIQRKRVKGYDMQAESRKVNGLPAKAVSRGTRWGNPFIIGKVSPLTQGLITNENCLPAFEAYCYQKMQLNEDWLEPLRGFNLACWCKVGFSCHRDVLLKLLQETEKAHD